MSVKNYFKKQFQLQKFFLRHDAPSDFYIGCFQNNRSVLPLLLLRTFLFLGCLSIMIASMVLTASSMPFKYWPIYLTHWGLIFNVVASGFSFAVSAAVFFKGAIDQNFGLPWYIKAYWSTFNIAIPIAFFITVFYWSLLTGIEQEFAINFTLDIFIHAVNSVLMLVLLFSARHPMFLMHFYFSIGIAIIYLVFTIIYYFTGGTDPFGNTTIYPMIDWAKPGETIGMVFLSAFGILLAHGVTVALSVGRDALSRRVGTRTTIYEIDEAYY